MNKENCKTSATFIAAVMALIIAGCASTAPVSSQPAAPDRPDWVLNPPEDEELIYGMGSAVSSNESRGWKMAENRARTSISYQITAIVEGMQEDYQKQAGNDGNEIGQNFFADVSRQLTASVLSGAKIAKRGTGSGGKYYALTSYSVSAVKDSVRSMTETAAKKAEISANAALQAMDKAFAAKRTPNLVESGGEE
jgi:hypothetical protein